MSPEEAKNEKRKKRLLARFRFKSLIRKVMINRYWLAELEDQKFGDNVRRNVAIIVRRKGEKGILTLGEKRILNKDAKDRTREEKKHILGVLANLKCFDRFPPIVRKRLAAASHYLYYNRGRTIIKQHHLASAMYFLLDGEITCFKEHWDWKKNYMVTLPYGVRRAGDMFGELGLLYDIKRIATMQTATDCELLCIYREDFDIILKPTLKAQWDQVKQSLSRFEFFKGWTDDQVHECCVLSKIKQFNPQQIIYNEDKGTFQNAYFVLSGKCTILQCLKMHVKYVKGKKKYFLVDMNKDKFSRLSFLKRLPEVTDKQKNIHITNKRENTDIHPNNIVDENNKNKKDIEHRFVDVGSYSCGSVFAIGELMEHRTILAQNVVQCMLVPRYWLFMKGQNAGNSWYRTKMYLDASIPSRENIFNDFISTLNWVKYRKEVVEDIVRKRENRNSTTKRDIPMICRIEEDL